MKWAEITVAAASVLALVGCDGQLPTGSPSVDGGPTVDTASPVDVGAAVDVGSVDLPPFTPPLVDQEGLPILGALPQESLSCTIVHASSSATETASWDAPSRTFR